MSRPSTVPPPPPEGGGARYAIVGVALAALAGLAWCMTRPPEAPPETHAEAAPDAGSRSTALVEDELEIPEIEPDAGAPDVGSPESGDGPRRPRIVAGDWDCGGELSPAAAASVVRGFDAQIRSCYERRLKANPLLQGNMSLRIKVAANGSVDGVQVGGSLRDRDVFSCVRTVAMRMRFPAVAGGSCAVLDVPYSFTPEE